MRRCFFMRIFMMSDIHNLQTMAIVKILSRHSPSYGSLIRYILREGKGDLPETFAHNLRSDDIDGIVREFLENESFRKTFRSDQVYLTHEIVSFGAKEEGRHLTPEVMADIAREYVRLRGNDGVMFGAVHRDRDHAHLHMCVSALKFRTGRSFRLSKAELTGLQVGLQEYHRNKYPALSHSLPEHGSGRPYDRHGKWRAEQRARRAPTKDELRKVMEETLSLSKTREEFLERLREKGYHHYERNGAPTGLEVDGQRFRFSRLLENDPIGQMPSETEPEDRALEEIRAIRERRKAMDRAPEPGRGAGGGLER